MKSSRVPLPARKVFISQIKNSWQSSASFNKPADPNLSGRFCIELEGGKVICFTNVWIQGRIVDIHELESKTVLRLNDDTGMADIFGVEAIMKKNMFLDTSFHKGMHVMMTGLVLQPVSEIPCIQASRISEIENFSKKSWESDVNDLQQYLAYKTRNVYR